MKADPKKLIGPVRMLKGGRTLKFSYRQGRSRTEGFLLIRKGSIYAYANRCRHIPLPLDFGDNEFFTEDGRYLLCKNHGALYEPGTGLCVSGPCAGESLESLPVRVAGGKIYYDGTEKFWGFRLLEE